MSDDGYGGGGGGGDDYDYEGPGCVTKNFNSFIILNVLHQPQI